MINTQAVDLLALMRHDTELRKVASTNGGEYAGPCPFCGGTDRFRVWPHDKTPRFWCRQCQSSGDAISYVQLIDRVDFKSAVEKLGLSENRSRTPVKSAPRRPLTKSLPKASSLKIDYPALTDANWQKAAVDFCEGAVNCLHSSEGRDAYNYLVCERHLTDDVITAMRLGYNPKNLQYYWGSEHVFLHSGIVIPWWINGGIWSVKLRGLTEAYAHRFGSAAGGANGLYAVNLIKPPCVVVLVEAEIDALTILSHVTPKMPHIVAVATGGTAGARIMRWVISINLADQILLAFDNDGEPGEQASAYWKQMLGNKAKRLRPTHKDVNQMVQEGDNIVDWILTALH